jgi:hypothetical protein
MPAGTLAFDPSQLAGLNSGANLGGGSIAGFLTPNPISAIGGNSNPFLPNMPSGTKMPATSSPVPASAPFSSPYAASGATADLAGLGTGLGSTQPGQNTLFGLPATGAQQDDIAKGLQKAGYAGGTGTALAAFLMSGAGYNPAVAQAMIAALQPQFAQGRANLMEQFGSEGLGMSSPAALGLGAYEAQTNLDVGTILSGLYEQSVQNYMQVLMGGKGQPHKSFWESIQPTVDTLIGGGSQVAKVAVGAGG